MRTTLLLSIFLFNYCSQVSSFSLHVYSTFFCNYAYLLFPCAVILCNAFSLVVESLKHLLYSFVAKTKFIKGLDLTLVARNLFFLYKDAPFDPDATLSVGNTLQGVDVFGMPTTRNIGFNVKFTF